jgi:hypothetical protein
MAGNHAIGDGGGLCNRSWSYQVAVSNSTLSSNSANGNGGGFVNDGTMTVSNSTVASNQAGQGGAVYNNFATLVLTSCTIANNTGGFGSSTLPNCGGIYSTSDDPSRLTLKNTIVADNHSNVATGRDIFGVVVSNGHNLIQSTLGAIISGPATRDIVGQDPQLGPLQNNYGPTQTMVPGPPSPALGAGDPSGAAATD